MKISILTINFNNKEGLVKTVESVINQTYNNIEYIIIDGASNDGSADYIKENKNHFAYWISEPDKGIYNAMNKGIDQATGDYLLFLNSGDWLYNEKVIAEFVSCKPTEDIVYGDSCFIHPDKENEIKIMPDNMEGMMIFYRTLNHQSVFHKAALFLNGRRYDDEYKILADWSFYNTVILIKHGTYRHINLLVSNYDASGFSSNPQNKLIMEKDRYKFYANHIDYFIPLMLENYESILKKYNDLKFPRIIKTLKRTKNKWRKFKKLLH